MYSYAIIQEAQDTIKIKNDLIELNDTLVKDYNKNKKITKEKVLKI